MRKKYIILLFLVSISLCSCMGACGKMSIFDNSDKKADARLKQLLEVIKYQDKDTLKSLFSERALNEAKDLDERIDYLFSLIEGNLESWDRIGGIGDESNNYGRKIIKLRYRYNVYTDKEHYLFSILEYTRDDNNPENIGLYCLKVINTKDEEPEFSDAGIYKPKE